MEVLDAPRITPEMVAEHGLSDEEYQRVLHALGREPNLVELGIFSVMWSEHCSYKSSRLHLKKLPTEAPWPRLSAHFAPVLAQPLPERLTAPLADAAKVVNLAEARAERRSLWRRRALRFGVPAALAASLVLAVLLPRGSEE